MPTLHPATPRLPARRPGRFALCLAALLVGLSLAPPAHALKRGLKKDLKFAVELARKGLWNEAEYRFRALLDRDPNSFRLWNNLAVACEATGDYPCAEQAYDKATTLRSEPPEPLMLNKEAFDAFYRTWSARRPAANVSEPGSRTPPEPQAGPDTPEGHAPSPGQDSGQERRR